MKPFTIHTSGEEELFSTKSILYVDDDQDDQEFFVHAIREMYPGLKCFTAMNGIEALDVLLKIPPPICIYIDINMPLMNGIELLQTLKAIPRYAEIPAVILSTTVSKSNAEIVKQLGALNCIIKPNTHKDLVLLLQTSLVSIL